MLSPKEYRLLCKAKRLKDIDENQRMAVQAFFNNKATLTDKKGKFICKKIEDIYSYKDAIDEAEENSQPLSSRMERYMNFLKNRKEEENG